MVLRAFESLSDVPTRLVCFSDDMDGLRKVPDNVPNQELLADALGQPLTSVPDPFGTHPSFGEHNNARLRSFLDGFGFEYEFLSATECYKSGRFDQTLRLILERYDEVIEVILPTLGKERQATYSPFLPVCQKTGEVLQVALTGRDAEAGTVSFRGRDGEEQTVPVTGGHVKCQWKVDWAMRWHALDVDYEMSGKDLIESVKLSSEVRRVLGSQPPEGFNYELFLDEAGRKISKSKGNGLSIEEWLQYASPESLALYMYKSPRKAKRLHFDVIPKTVDEYYSFVERYATQEPEKRLANPVYHVHGGAPPEESHLPLGFSLLLNLVSASHATDKEALWGFVERYVPGASAKTHPELDRMMEYAVRYYGDFVAPGRVFRLPTDAERPAFEALVAAIRALPEGATAEEFQNQVYEVGKAHGFEKLGQWFQALYECLLGQSRGPRMGGFIALYGPEETAQLIERALRGELVEG